MAIDKTDPNALIIAEQISNSIVNLKQFLDPRIKTFNSTLTRVETLLSDQSSLSTRMILWMKITLAVGAVSVIPNVIAFITKIISLF